MSESDQKSVVVSALLHLIATITYAVSVYACLNNGLPQELGQLLGHWKFLTFWNLNVQLVTFAIALVVDVIGRNDSRGQRTSIAKVLDLLFNALALPITAYVSISFWSIYTVDRDLIFPAWIEQYIPLWLNHCIHTVILPVVLLENYLVDHRRSHQKHGLKATMLFVGLYTVLILYLGIAKDYWVYPVLRVMNWPIRVLFISCSLATSALFYGMGGLLYKLAWGSGSSKKAVPRQRKSAKNN